MSAGRESNGVNMVGLAKSRQMAAVRGMARSYGGTGVHFLCLLDPRSSRS